MKKKIKLINLYLNFILAFFEKKYTSNGLIKLSDFNVPFKEVSQYEDSFSNGFHKLNLKNFICSDCKKLDKNKNVSLSDFLEEEISNGYFQGCLEWTKMWNNETKQKILIDINFETFSNEKINPIVFLDYYLQHHNWPALKNILKSYDSEVIKFLEVFFKKIKFNL